MLRACWQSSPSWRGAESLARITPTPRALLHERNRADLLKLMVCSDSIGSLFLGAEKFQRFGRVRLPGLIEISAASFLVVILIISPSFIKHLLSIVTMGCSGSKLDCTYVVREPSSYWADTIQANPDIAGIGVVLSFIIAFAFTFIVASVAHCLPATPPSSGHPVDKFASQCWSSIGCLRRKHPNPAPLSPPPNQKMREALTTTLLSLCSQQQVLGIAIMSARYTICHIQLYHSEIVRILVFLCVGSQITAMQALSSYYQQHLAIRNVAVFLFLVCSGLVLHLIIIHGRRCHIRDREIAPHPIPGLLWVEPEAAFKLEEAPKPLLVVNLVLFVLATTFGLSSCFQPILEFATNEKLGVKPLVSKLLTTIYSPLALYLANASLPVKMIIHIAALPLHLFTILAVTLLVPWFLLRAYLSLCRSHVIVLALELAWFIYMVYSLFWTRHHAGSYRYKTYEGEEDEWNFGQVLPMVLVVLPVLGAWQGYRG